MTDVFESKRKAYIENKNGSDYDLQEQKINLFLRNLPEHLIEIDDIILKINADVNDINQKNLGLSLPLWAKKRLVDLKNKKIFLLAEDDARIIAPYLLLNNIDVIVSLPTNEILQSATKKSINNIEMKTTILKETLEYTSLKKHEYDILCVDGMFRNEEEAIRNLIVMKEAQKQNKKVIVVSNSLYENTNEWISIPDDKKILLEEKTIIPHPQYGILRTVFEYIV